MKGQGWAQRDGADVRHGVARRRRRRAANSTTSSPPPCSGTRSSASSCGRKDGRILYSDEPALIGSRYPLGEEERELFETGRRRRGRAARRESCWRRTPIRTPDGTQLLFAIYQRFSSVHASGGRLLSALAPPLVGGLGVLVLFQLPLDCGVTGGG